MITEERSETQGLGSLGGGRAATARLSSHPTTGSESGSAEEAAACSDVRVLW